MRVKLFPQAGTVSPASHRAHHTDLARAINALLSAKGDMIHVREVGGSLTFSLDMDRLLPRIPKTGVFPVVVTKDGGIAGSDVADCTWTYTVASLAGIELATLVTPVQFRYSSAGYYFAGEEVNEVATSTYADAFFDGDTLILKHVPGETLQETRCEIPWFNAVSWSLLRGTMGGGLLSWTYDEDATYLVINELTDADPLNFTVTFANLPETANTVTLICFYAGNPAHNLKIRMWDYNTSQFDNLTGDANDFPSGSTNDTYVFTFIPADHRSPTGAAIMEIEHTSGGTNTHNFNIDKLTLSIV